MPHHLLDRGFRRQTVQLHENVRLAVFDEFIRPADALDRRGDAGVVQQFDHAAAEAIVKDVVLEGAHHLALAGEALEILNSSKITALIVTEGKKPVGIVHLHDLLRAGVA